MGLGLHFPFDLCDVDCDANMCPPMDTKCPVGKAPVLEVPDGKCCPVIKCGIAIIQTSVHCYDICMHSFLFQIVSVISLFIVLLFASSEPKKVCVHKNLEYEVTKMTVIIQNFRFFK